MNRVAADQRAAYQNTLCSPGIGAEPQQARKNTRSASAVRVFFVFVGTHALLANILILAFSLAHELHIALSETLKYNKPYDMIILQISHRHTIKERRIL